MYEDELTIVSTDSTQAVLTVFNPPGDMVVTVRYDGSVKFGPGFRVGFGRGRRAAKEFWRQLGLRYPHKDCVAPEPFKWVPFEAEHGVI